jgi:hypothetical protein
MSDLMDLAEWLQVAWSSDARNLRWANGWKFKPTNAVTQQLLQQPLQLDKHGNK